MKIDFDFSHFCRSVVVGYENWIVFPDKLYISLRATRKFRRNMRESEAMYSNEMFLLTHFVFCEMCRMSPHKLWVTTERRNSSQQCNGENVLRKRYNSRYSRDTWDVCIERWRKNQYWDLISRQVMSYFIVKTGWKECTIKNLIILPRKSKARHFYGDCSVEYEITQETRTC